MLIKYLHVITVIIHVKLNAHELNLRRNTKRKFAMSEENKTTVMSEQSEDEHYYDEMTTSTLDRVKKKSSKFSELKSEMSSIVRRGKLNGSVMDLMDVTELIEPIIEPVISLCELKYGFYRDLRTLVPPPSDGSETRSVDGMLREMHEAIDEINRKLDDINLPLISGCNNSIGGPETYVDDLSECAKSPLRVARPKPNTGIEMKIYRLKNNLHRTGLGIVNRCEK